jgi:N-acetylglucosamine-6-phosphate deacetylase
MTGLMFVSDVMSGNGGGCGTPPVGMALDMSGRVRNASELLGLSPAEVAPVASEYSRVDFRIPSGKRGRGAAVCHADLVIANNGLLTETWIAAVRGYGVVRS